MPFWPGGLDDVLVDPEDGGRLSGRPKGLRTVPPGFARGLRLSDDEGQDETFAALEEIPVAGQSEDAEEVRCFTYQGVDGRTHLVLL